MRARGVYHNLVTVQGGAENKNNFLASDNKVTNRVKSAQNELTVRIQNEGVDNTQMQSQKSSGYVRKILKLQRKELTYIIIGSLSQLVCGAVFPGI